jgi:3',5'-cyclic AMP phosphodiesterase CpdA
MTAAAELSLVHLSDVHVFHAGAIRPGHLLGKRVTGAVNALLRRRHVHRQDVTRAALEALGRMPVDHLVITGDISTLGARTELETFLAEVRRLGLPPAAVTVVPGNHDAYVPDVVRRGDFASVFAPYQTSDPGWVGPDPFPVVRLRGPLALIACTTAVPSWPLLAIGTLGPAQLERLAAVLADPRLSGRARVVALHHPPQPGVGRWHNRLTDAAALRRVIAEHGAELVLHGHLHRSLGFDLPGPTGPVPVRGVASVSSTEASAPRRAQLRRFVLAAGRLRAEESWRFDLASGQFEREDDPL